MITTSLSEPFYFSSVAVSAAEVPGRWDVGLAGVGYMIDFELSEGLTRGTDGYQHQSIPLIRQQADTSFRPGEQSLNPDDLWRRSAETWEGGAGQNYYDRSFSIDGMYRASTGIDPSVKGQMSLLNATGRILATANTNLYLTVAGSYLYAIDGSALKYTNAIAFPSTWTSVTGLTGTPNSICSDGHQIYITTPTDVYYTTLGAGSASAFHSVPLAGQTLARYAKGRLITTAGPVVYDNTAQGSGVPTALYTQPNGDWTWVDVAEGPNAIYLAGYSGDKTIIYSTAIKTDGTALDAPTVAGVLPDGELVRSLCGYLGFLLIGSTKGLRFATLDSTGAISTIGDLIPTSDPVVGFEPQDRFVWFCGGADDNASLGRVDLRTINGSTPAYWNDLAVADTHAPASSVVTYQGIRVFSTGQGVYAQTSDKVPSGTISSGYIDYNLADDKTALRIATKHGPGAGSYTVSLGVDDQEAQILGPPILTQSSTTGGSILSMNSKGALFEVFFTLTRDTVDTTSGPVLRRWTLRSAPSAERRRTITVPLMLHQTVTDKTGYDQHYDPLAQVAAIAALANSSQVVPYQEGYQAYSVIVMDYHWVPNHKSPTGENFDGTCSIVLGTV